MKTATLVTLTPRCESALKNLLGFMRAMHWNHWTTHWQVQGMPYYGDHLMFQRIYEAMGDEIDGLAEKIVAMCGVGCVDDHDSIDRTHNVLKRWVTQYPDDIINRAFNTEQEFQTLLAGVYELLDAEGHLTLGLDNFLQGLADAHETNLYLLQQRMGNN